MKKTRKTLTAIVCVLIVLTSSITALAGTRYANYFESWETSDKYKCYFSFIAAHEIQRGETYCTEVGEHIRQAYVIAYNANESSGRKYSAAAISRYDSLRRTTPVASVKKVWYRIEYTKYGYSTFK